LAAYEVLGGDVFYDLNIRNRTQPLFLVRADESTPPQMFSDGTVMGGQGLADGPSATLVQYMRGWMSDVVDYKREYLERKIRRMIDYGEQLRMEVELLHRIVDSEQAEGSLDFTISEIQGLLDDPMYRAVSKEGDAHNKLGGAPYASYQPGPNREGVSYQRGFGGPSTPGDKGDTA
jgi:hypothetical protein